MIRPADPPAIEQAAEILLRGGLVGMPTETVYGLAGVATNVDAVASIFKAKQRPTFNPLIVHVSANEQIEALVHSVPAVARELIDAFWPGPLTLVLPKTALIDDLVTAGMATVAVRCPAHPVARRLIEAVGQPLAAPSANRYMQVSPTTARHVADLGPSVEMILDAGPCATGIESTVIGWNDQGRPVLLRLGGLAPEDVEQITGKLNRPVGSSPNHSPRPSPGMTSRHYAPSTPLHLISPEQFTAFEPSTTGLLLCSGMHRPGNANAYQAVTVLSETGDTKEAATRLFAALREMDRSGVQRILATRAPATGLGPAINDRLTRAAATS